MFGEIGNLMVTYEARINGQGISGAVLSAAPGDPGHRQGSAREQRRARLQVLRREPYCGDETPARPRGGRAADLGKAGQDTPAVLQLGADPDDSRALDE